ncbi:MAG: endonuclease/exonuclease/phosphatase family protein [Polyangiaceae bacterium]
MRCSLSLACGLLLLGCGERPLEPRDPTPGVAHYLFKTYNIEAGDSGDGATLKAVGAGDPDVVVLQEVNPAWEDALRAYYTERYPFQLYRAKDIPDPGAAGLGVLAKFPVRDGGWHPGVKSDWHPGWHVLVDTPAGTIQILNVHLRSAHTGNGNVVKSYLSTNSDHSYQMSLFYEQCGVEIPTLVMGDFNEGVDGGGVEYLEARGFRNALPLYHPGQFTWRHTSIANQFTQTLDHALFNDAFEPLNAWTQNLGHSDHIPVLVHLEAAYPWQVDGIDLASSARARAGDAAALARTQNTTPSSTDRRRTELAPWKLPSAESR